MTTEDGTAGLTLGYQRNRDDPTGAAQRARLWASENAAALEAYNRFVEQNGVVGDDFRSW